MPSEDGVAKSGNPDNWSTRCGCIADEIVQVPPRRLLVRDRPLQPCISPHVLKPNAGRLVPSVEFNQFERRLHGLAGIAVAPCDFETIRKRRTVSEQWSDPLTFHLPNEGGDGSR